MRRCSDPEGAPLSSLMDKQGGFSEPFLVYQEPILPTTSPESA
jgi:hypothetical protein